VTLTLALLLLLLGLAGAKSVALLQDALRTPSADDIAQRACTIYQRQDYNFLLDQIDPTPLPPAYPNPFDANARHALLDQLESLDASVGKVTQCSYRALTFDNNDQSSQANQRQYVFTMERSTTYTTVMTLARQPDGSWKISRDSNFFGGPATGYHSPPVSAGATQTAQLPSGSFSMLAAPE
jgi:hypothetical protein